MRPNLIVILIDDLRFDETGASGHPYMKTPHIDRLASEADRHGFCSEPRSARASSKVLRSGASGALEIGLNSGR